MPNQADIKIKKQKMIQSPRYSTKKGLKGGGEKGDDKRVLICRAIFESVPQRDYHAEGDDNVFF